MKKFIQPFVCVCIGIVMFACGKDPIADLSPEDSQVFITNYLSTANYGSYKTFSISDSIFTQKNQQIGVSTGSIAQLMVNKTVSNLTQRGYTRIPRGAKPDLGVNIIYITESQTNVVANNNAYWGNYYGYGGGYNLYYPTSYSFYQTVENYWYIEIIDLKNISTNNNATIIWNAQIRGNGLLDNDLLLTMVDKVFAQSQYLKNN